MRLLLLALPVLALAACHSDSTSGAGGGGSAEAAGSGDAAHGTAAVVKPLDGGWPGHIDATPLPDATPRIDVIGPDVAMMPVATAPLVFWLAHERIEIPGDWVACQTDGDCVVSSARCAERTVFTVSRAFADRAQERADRPCRGQLVSSPPSITKPTCKARRCQLIP